MPKNLCHRELQKVYRLYNERWFLGALPDDCDCMFAPTDNCHGIVELETGGWLLSIDPKYAIEGRIWRMTLLHEQTHLLVSPYPWHGKQFQTVMQGLALTGAFKGLW